jgi:hypothetical protein
MDYSAPLARLPKAPARPFRWLKRLVIGLAVTAVVLGVVTVVVRYVLLLNARKRTEEIIARLDRDDPGWRLDEIEAARKVVPDAENSAIPLMAAARLLPSNWPQRVATNSPNGPGREEADRGRVIASVLDSEWTRYPSEEQIIAVRAELESLAPALTVARKVVDMPEGRFAVAYALDPLTTPLLDEQNARNSARLLKLDSIIRVHDGDFDGAIASCRGILNVGRSIGDEPFAITQLLRIAVETVSVRSIEHVLAFGEPSEESLASIQGALEIEESQPMLLQALRGERAMLNDLYSRLASRELTKLGGEDLSPTLHWLYAEAMHAYARGVVLEEMNGIIPIAKAPFSSQIELTRAWESGFSKRASASFLDRWARLLLPAFPQNVESNVTSRARLRTTIVAIAAERYRRKQGRWPESIEELTPWPLAQVPADPCNDEPLIWLRVDDTLVIYSTGPDFDDNGGALEQDAQVAPSQPNKPRPDKPYWEDKDIGIRLHDVTSRHK